MDRGAGVRADGGQRLDQRAQPLGGELALEPGRVSEHPDAGEPLDEPCVRPRALVSGPVQDDADRLETELPRGEDGQRRVIDGPEPRTGDAEPLTVDLEPGAPAPA